LKCRAPPSASRSRGAAAQAPGSRRLQLTVSRKRRLLFGSQLDHLLRLRVHKQIDRGRPEQPSPRAPAAASRCPRNRGSLERPFKRYRICNYIWFCRRLRLHRIGNLTPVAAEPWGSNVDAKRHFERQPATELVIRRSNCCGVYMLNRSGLGDSRLCCPRRASATRGG